MTRRFLLATLMLAIFIPCAAQATESSHRFDKRLTGYTYPFPVKSFEVSTQGQTLTMAYMYLAPKGDMPVVTLLHGKNFNGAYFDAIATTLHKAGYGVLMPDQIGFGKSAKPVNYQYSFAALASHTRELMSSLNIERSIILGHSMGGMLASRFALLYPDVTTQLILVNPIGLENYLQYVQYKDVDFFYQKELNKTPESIVSYQRENYYDGDWNDSYEALTVPLQGWVRGDDWEVLAKVSALTYDMIFTQPVIDEFDDFTMPVTLIIGTRDTTGPGRNWKKEGVDYTLGEYDKLGNRVKARNRQIDVKPLPGLGHLPFIEDYSQFKLVLLDVLGEKRD